MMSTTTEGPSGQLISWRQQSLERFVSHGGLVASPASNCAQQPATLRFCKDPYTISHPIYATCGRVRMGKPAVSISKAILQISHSKMTHVATVPCPLHYRGRESNQGVNLITMDSTGKYFVVASRSGFIRIYEGRALVDASYDR